MRLSSRFGYFYIISNPYIPNLYKIGSSKNLDQRIIGFNKNTIVPGNFIINFQDYSDKFREIEILVLRSQKDFLLKPKEFCTNNLDSILASFKEAKEKIKSSNMEIDFLLEDHNEIENQLSILNKPPLLRKLATIGRENYNFILLHDFVREKSKKSLKIKESDLLEIAGNREIMTIYLKLLRSFGTKLYSI